MNAKVGLSFAIYSGTCVVFQIMCTIYNSTMARWACIYQLMSFAIVTSIHDHCGAEASDGCTDGEGCTSSDHSSMTGNS